MRLVERIQLHRKDDDGEDGRHDKARVHMVMVSLQYAEGPVVALERNRKVFDCAILAPSRWASARGAATTASPIVDSR